MTALSDPPATGVLAKPRRFWRFRDGATGTTSRQGAMPQPAAVRAGLFPWLPVLLAAGIALWFARPFVPTFVSLCATAGVMVIAAMVSLRARSHALAGEPGWQVADAVRLGAWAALVVAAGLGLAQLRATQVSAPVLGFRYYGPIEGRVVEIDRSARDRMRLTLDRVRLRDMAPDRTPALVRVSLMDMAADTGAVVGQRVMLTGHLGPPPGPASPGSFDFRSMAWFQGLGAVGYVRTPILPVAAPEGGIWVMDRTRMGVAAAMRDSIGGQRGAVAAALMTGDRSGIAEATNEIMRASNLYHIISISGLHMGMLAGFVYNGLRLALVGAVAAGLALRWPVHKIAATVALAAAAGYLWLSGGGVATERAFVMVAVMLCAILADRRAISLRSIAIAALIILAYSPEAVTSPGFQMSFAATVALVLCYGPWRQVGPKLPFWLRPVAMLIISSMVAGLATSPIAAALFSRMAHYGLLANLLVVPVMGSLVMPMGVIAALLAPIGLAGPALWVMGLGTGWMLWIAEWIAGLNGAVSAVPLPPWQVVPLMGFGATVAILSWRRGMMRTRSASLAGASVGLAMLIAAFGLWLTTSRPQILIAPEGEGVGLMTAEGRSLSKPSGGSFVVDTWLSEDGDMATQEQAAARPAWSGDRRDRLAELPDGWRLMHFTGKGSGERAAQQCHAQTILVATEAIPDLPQGAACLIFDQKSLRRTGAVAVEIRDGRPMLLTVTETAGAAPWVAAQARRPSRK
ncbi:ComEC family competence protein [Paracoccus sp. TK19116]|uniref:ComEC family competence protein n=1 Tax=Paracoccus albicereus TaxID=2922394 RepID=A0ABT1MP39_9RHOB|nr:ComEC/Rec2 family competence protein [Paracoccus albicereus]MCQ0970055.1 ComEC family competence protein [Paracoccus albicereus]